MTLPRARDRRTLSKTRLKNGMPHSTFEGLLASQMHRLLS
jgi:hypothetical protein